MTKREKRIYLQKTTDKVLNDLIGKLNRNVIPEKTTEKELEQILANSFVRFALFNEQ